MSWKNANDIEQQMVFIMDIDALDFEIERKLLGSKRYFDDEYIKLYQDKINNINSDANETKKDFLLRLIQDIQWQIGKRKLMEPFVKKTILLCMAISILLTLVTYTYIYTDFDVSKSYSPDINRWYFPLVVSAGFMGTVFSMLIGVAKQSNELILDDLRILSSTTHILARIVLGVGAALLFYYYFNLNLFLWVYFQISTSWIIF